MKRNKYLVIRFRRQCYSQVYNSSSKCPAFAYATRQLRRQWRSGPCRAKRPANDCSIRQAVYSCDWHSLCSLVNLTQYFVIEWIKVGAIKRPLIWRNEIGRWLLKKQSHRVTCQVWRCATCLVERRRNRLTRRLSPATAVVMGACRSNSRRRSSSPDGQRWGPWGQALRCRRTP